MKGVDYPDAVKVLVAQLRRLPGIGPRSAERMTLWLVQHADAKLEEIISALQGVGQRVGRCERCGFFAEENICGFCSDLHRDSALLCVVERATDMLPVERTGAFRGFYHALGGRIAPLDHVGPEDLRIDALLDRVRDEKPREVILALSTDVEGEATANYLAGLLRPLGVEITRIAQGLPVGGGLENADGLTLQRALSGRREF